MRFIKFAFAGLIVLFILLTMIGLLMPSAVTVLRTVEIHASFDSVRIYTNNPVNWRRWINGADTAYFKQLTNSDTSKSSKFIIGAYTVTILQNNANYIVTDWLSENNNEQLNRLQLYQNSAADIVDVSWSFEQHLNWYPWERLSAMLRDQVFGPSMEVSLANLKRICEK